MTNLTNLTLCLITVFCIYKLTKKESCKIKYIKKCYKCNSKKCKCKTTKYGFCPDGITPKIDKEGTNCYNYQEYQQQLQKYYDQQNIFEQKLQQIKDIQECSSCKPSYIDKKEQNYYKHDYQEIKDNCKDKNKHYNHEYQQEILLKIEDITDQIKKIKENCYQCEEKYDGYKEIETKIDYIKNRCDNIEKYYKDKNVEIEYIDDSYEKERIYDKKEEYTKEEYTKEEYTEDYKEKIYEKKNETCHEKCPVNPCATKCQKTVENSAELISDLLELVEKCKEGEKVCEKTVEEYIKIVKDCMKEDKKYKKACNNYNKAIDILRENLKICKSDDKCVKTNLGKYIEEIYS